jgi:hypothetical protein
MEDRVALTKLRTELIGTLMRLIELFKVFINVKYKGTCKRANMLTGRNATV